MLAANLYFLRVNQPGYGPKIVTCLMSDLGPVKVGPFTDLRSKTERFSGSGPPSASTLLAGNYSALIPGSGYLVDDLYIDDSANNIYRCSTAGSNASSAWTQISGAGGNQFAIYTIGAVTADIQPGYVVSTGGVQINKPPELAGNLVSETIDGVLMTYSSYSNNFNTRIATDPSSNAYTQYITPRYSLGQTGIIAVNITGSWYELSPSRVWGGTP